MFIFLIALFLPPDEKKFLEKIVESQSRRMWLLSIDILKNKEIAEDAVQTSFLILIRKVSLLMNFESEDKVNGYVYVITKNTALSIIRKGKKHNHLNLSDFENILTDLEINVEKTVIINDELNYIEQEILLLKPIYKEAIYLKYYPYLDYPEIAGALNISVENARVRVSTGLQKIRQRAKNRGDFNE